MWSLVKQMGTILFWQGAAIFWVRNDQIVLKQCRSNMSGTESFGRALYGNIFSRNTYWFSPTCQVLSGNENTTVNMAHPMHSRVSLFNTQDSEGSALVEMGPVSQSNSRWGPDPASRILAGKGISGRMDGILEGRIWPRVWTRWRHQWKFIIWRYLPEKEKRMINGDSFGWEIMASGYVLVFCLLLFLLFGLRLYVF